MDPFASRSMKMNRLDMKSKTLHYFDLLNHKINLNNPAKRYVSKIKLSG